MRPNRLERHLSSKHKDKPKEFFAIKSENLKLMKLDSTGYTAQTSEKVLKALYELSLLIAKEKKSHIIGETLVKPCLLKVADIILGTQSKQKLSQISVSDNTVKRRIDDMAEDIQNQVVDAVKQSPFFAIQLDESTDIAQCSQLIVYVRYIENEKMKDELLFSTELETTTKAIDVTSSVRRV
ncbi:protein FAM200C-like [Diabrotica undecimpunctata]|uniref:protein FAM200C-like n=1 Tax=Diabrotica undecimpunctata TaxID=50387 RepID=UPI003B63EC2A